MKMLRNTILVLAFAFVALLPSGGTAQAATVEEMAATIKSLMSQIESLQKQLNTVRGEVKAVLKEGLKEGMTDADIAKIQELLATDPTIYPEGKKTGFFGPLTKEAVKRFQARHGLPITGTVDKETRNLLEEYLHEGFGDKIPPGLLKAPGIMKKVEARYAEGCEAKGMGPLCKKLKTEHDNDAEDFDVEMELEDDTLSISFTLDDAEYDFETRSREVRVVLKAVADEIDVEVEDLDKDLVRAIKHELAKTYDADTEEARDDANEAIETAEDAVEGVHEAIEAAEDNEDTDEAEDLLEDAESYLKLAKEAYEDKNYERALLKANMATEFAEDALETFD